MRRLVALVALACTVTACDGCRKGDGVTVAWDKKWSTARGTADAIATDATGAIVVAGRFHDGSIDFGGGPLVASKTAIEQTGDAWIAKLDASGAHVWSKRFGDGWTCMPSGVAFDKSGNVIVVGTYGGAIDFGGGALPKPIERGRYVFGVSFDGAGNHRWSRMLGESNGGARVAVDGDGNAILVGKIADAYIPASTESYVDSIAVVKLDSAGKTVFAKRFGYATEMVASGIDVDASGAIVVAGWLRIGWIDCGGGRETSDPIGIDPFVVKLDATGKHVFTKLYRVNDGVAHLNALAVAQNGAIAIAGDVDWRGVDFGDGHRVGKRFIGFGTSAFVAGLDASGKHVFSRAFESHDITGDVAADAVTVGPSGDVLAAGHFKGGTSFGGATLASMRGRAFALSMGASGAPMWSKALGGEDDIVEANAIAVDASGALFVAGESYGQEYPRVVNAHGPNETTLVRPQGEGGREVHVTKLTKLKH